MRNVIDYIIKNRIIVENFVEIGSRDGHECFQIEKELKVKDISLFEPNSESFENICKDYPQYNNFKYAISNERGLVNFNAINNSNKGVSSLLNRCDNFYEKNNVKKIDVECIKGEDIFSLIKKEKISLIKIDVEGFAYEVIESFENKISNISMIYVECEHKQVWQNQKLYTDVSILLQKTHKQILTDYIIGDIQSNSLWLKI